LGRCCGWRRPSETGRGVRTPSHDKASYGADAFRYLAYRDLPPAVEKYRDPLINPTATEPSGIAWAGEHDRTLPPTMRLMCPVDCVKPDWDVDSSGD
jgi:hypothetical protein